MVLEFLLQDNDPFDILPERTCRVCGCSDNDACLHPKYGNCWWVEADLCSHCSEWPGESTRYSEILKLTKNTP